MFILGNFLSAGALVLDYALTFYMYIIIARAVISWVNADPYNPIVNFLHNATEPILHEIRKRLPFNMGGLDISPIILILVIIFLQEFLVNSLRHLAINLI